MVLGKGIRLAVVYAVVSLLLIIAFIQLVPSSWLRARPKGESQGIDTAIILGFGYEETGTGEMRPGAANEFLLRWVRESFPDIKTILVQEGVWTAECRTSDSTCRIGDVELLRIHRHDPNLDVNTLDTAVCTIKRLNDLGKKKAILVAHHLQLWRAAKVFERSRQALCKDCEFVIPNVPDTPYPVKSAQWRTRSEIVYRMVEVLSRLRDSKFMTPRISEECIAPIDEEITVGKQ